MPNFCICEVINDRAYNLWDLTDHVRLTSVADIQLLMPTEYIVNILQDMKTF